MTYTCDSGCQTWFHEVRVQHLNHSAMAAAAAVAVDDHDDDDDDVD